METRQQRPRRSREQASREPERKRAPRRKATPPKAGQQPAGQPPKKRAVAAPEVVYTPAKPLNRNRILLRLATVVAVVLALVFAISIFFKVEHVTVSGTEKYDAWTVKEASGIELGDNLLTFGKAKAYGKIKATLPYVDQVHIGIKLPDTVHIVIKELDVVYAMKDS